MGRMSDYDNLMAAFFQVSSGKAAYAADKRAENNGR